MNSIITIALGVCAFGVVAYFIWHAFVDAMTQADETRALVASDPRLENPFKATISPDMAGVLAKLREEGYEVAHSSGNDHALDEVLDVIGCLVYASEEMDSEQWAEFLAALWAANARREARHEKRGFVPRAGVARVIRCLEDNNFVEGWVKASRYYQ